MKYKVKGLSGSVPTVSFRCEHCRGGIVASLEEAGQSTGCPSCGATIAVPAGAELAEWKRHRADQERAAMKKQAERTARRERKGTQVQEAAEAALAAAETGDHPEPASPAAGLDHKQKEPWHVRLNDQLASAISVLNAVAFYVIIAFFTIAGGIAGGTDGWEYAGYAGQFALTAAGILAGFTGGATMAIMCCGLIAVLINISNKLSLIARAHDDSQ